MQYVNKIIADEINASIIKKLHTIANIADISLCALLLHCVYDQSCSHLYSYLFIGQFLKTGVEIQTQKQILTFPDGRLPLPVFKDLSATSDRKQCWRAANYGNQGEGLILGDILDYIVPHILSKTKTLL